MRITERTVYYDIMPAKENQAAAKQTFGFPASFCRTYDITNA